MLILFPMCKVNQTLVNLTLTIFRISSFSGCSHVGSTYQLERGSSIFRVGLFGCWAIFCSNSCFSVSSKDPLSQTCLSEDVCCSPEKFSDDPSNERTLSCSSSFISLSANFTCKLELQAISRTLSSQNWLGVDHATPSSLSQNWSATSWSAFK